jgi:rSAM/selenodomain-associated transferase 1
MARINKSFLVLFFKKELLASLLCMTCAIAVMAKAPQPGRSKTRLVPPLLPEQAARLSAAFLRDVTENILAAGRRAPIQGFAAYAPLGLEHLFEGHLAAGTRLILADGSIPMPEKIEKFGRCLFHAIHTLLAAGYDSAVVLNSDSPTLPTALLDRTARLLAQPGERAVLGPADDGGYYLLGVKSPHAHLFADIAWSTETVAAQTLLRAQEIGLEVVRLPAWYDVDDAESLARLIRDTAPGAAAADGAEQPFAAPATVAALFEMRLHEDAALRERA